MAEEKGGFNHGVYKPDSINVFTFPQQQACFNQLPVDFLCQYIFLKVYRIFIKKKWEFFQIP